jgi:hypothetical protein
MAYRELLPYAGRAQAVANNPASVADFVHGEPTNVGMATSFGNRRVDACSCRAALAIPRIPVGCG